MLVSVIVPTTCEVRRARELRRALASVLNQPVPVELLLVVNGTHVDKALLAELSQESRLRVIRREEGHVSAARHAGLLQAQGDYVCFLDDDDELLPDSLNRRLEGFESGWDVQVCNGFEFDGSIDRQVVPPADIASINRDPMGTFLKRNWFSSSSAMFRRGVDAALFDIPHRYFEWTLLFFRLYGAGLRIGFSGEMGYRIHQGTPVSVSKSAAYAEAYPRFLEELWASESMRQVGSVHRRQLRAKLATAFNVLAQTELHAGRRGAAWRAHLRCLRWAGFRYLTFTHRLLF